MQIMVTNDGAHPPGKWAEVSTNEIMSMIQLADSATPEQRSAVNHLRADLFDVLMAEHTKVQDAEREACKKDGKRCHDRNIPVGDKITGAAAKVDAVFAASPFAEHFAKPEVKSIVQRIIGQHFTTSMHIERQWAQNRQRAKG